ncbi:MAG: hypothetical protein GXO48_00070, partial [Chlorobi bacterium]|nr:hypothetical protein [Chlorobiota bacterium]
MRWGVLLVASLVAPATTIFAQTTIFSENFATTNPGSIPAGWVLGDGGDVRDQAPPLNYDSTWTVVSDYNGNDLGYGKFLFIGYNPGGRQADTITTPLINANVKGWLYLAYLTYYDNLDANDSGMVQVFDGLNWREVKKYGAATGDVGGWGNQAAWQIINITDYISSALRVRFIYHDNNNLYWAIDSIVIYNVCDPPVVDVEWIAIDSVELTFYPSYDSLRIEYGPAGFSPGTGTSFIVVPTSQTIKISGLNHAQDYEFYVTGFCGSSASLSPTIYYLCRIQPLPYYEDFETTPKWEVPQCWKAYPNEGADTVGVDNTTGCVYGTQSLVIFGGQGQGFWALAPYVNTQNVNSVRASFRYRAGTNNTCGNSPETQDSLFLEVWTGNTWEKVLGFGGSAAQTFIHANAYIPTSNMDMLRVRFRAVGSGPSYDNWYVDSFLITAGPCIKPMSVSASFNNSNDTIIVSWGPEGSDSIVIEYGFPGFAVGSGNRIYVDVQGSNTVRIPVPFGSYEVYVWGQCNGQGSIDTFYSLLCGPIPTPALETFDNGRYFEACWAQTIDYAAKIDTCLSDGGHLFLWGKNNSVVTSPAYYTQQNKVHKISYYYRTGGNSCGDVPEKGDKLTINISNNGTLWNTLVQMDGFFDHSPNWQYREYYVCSNTSELYLQFSTTGLGIGYDSWHIDSLYVGPTSNSPDVIVVDVVANNGLVCDSGYFGTIGIVYRNVGNSPVDTVVVGYRLNGSLFLDTVYYASGFGGSCANFTDLDTAYIPLSVSGVGVYPITTFARAISNDGNPTDTFRHNLVVGDKFLYIGIGTASYSSEIYWKLFYLPDSQLVMSVPSGTYTNNSYTVDSVCALSGALYRFEAWDSYGDGWNGGYFDLFVKAICGDTAFITQYNYVGSIPGKLEKIFYFSIPQTDSAYNIRIVDLLSSTTLSICGDTFNEPITVSFQNIGINALDTVLVGINLSNVVSKIDTLIYTGGFKPCEVDTYTIFNPALYDYIGRLDVWTTTPADQNKLNDSIRTGIAAGTRWTYVKITTGSYAHEVYWKLFMVPDSVLVGYVPNGTYNASNSTFVDSVCLANHYNYRFEAWDWAGNGWSGGTYELYTYTDCRDYIFLINNNGNPVPNTPSTFLETVEYFTLDVDSNIALLSMTPDTATYICSSSHTITVNIKNTDGSATLNVPVTLNELISGFNTTQTVTVGPCQTLPVQFNVSFPNIGAMHYIATANIPSDPYLADNDTLSVELYYLPADSFDAYFSASIDATARCLGDTVRITLPQAILYQEDFEGSP